MADIKYLGKTYSGVSKVKFHNAVGNDYTEFSAGGGSSQDFIDLIERDIVNLSIPTGTTKIGKYALSYCDNIVSITMPNTITTLTEYCMCNNKNLETVVFSNALTEIPNYCFDADYKLAITELPSTITRIGNYAFKNCESLESIKCLGALTALSSSPFQSSSAHPMKLKVVRFPNAVSGVPSGWIGNTTANNACKQLELVDIGFGGSGMSIGSSAFANCYAFNKLIIRKTGAIYILSNTNAFTNTPFAGYNSGTGVVYVPSALIDTYKSASNWSTLYNSGNGYLSFSALETSPYADPNFVLS